MTRTFVAIFPPANVTAAIDAAVAPLRAGTGRAGLKWERAANLHYTVRFLGPLAPAEVEAARRAVVAAAAGGVPFRVRLGGAGAFPGPTRPRVLWLGVADGALPLVTLAGDVERALVRQRFAAAERPFTPHLTIARVGEGALPTAETAIAAFLGLAPPALEFAVSELQLVASTLAPGGSRYEVLERAPLGGSA